MHYPIVKMEWSEIFYLTTIMKNETQLIVELAFLCKDDCLVKWWSVERRVLLLTI